jgi:hypothetical protein
MNFLYRFLYSVLILHAMTQVSALTLTPESNPPFQIGDNVYTVGFNLVIPPSPPANFKYYEMSSVASHVTIIQKAVTDIGLVGGGTVLIKTGTYLIDNKIELGSNLQIIGDGTDKTILKLVDGSNTFSSLFHSKSKQNIALSKMGINGNRGSILESSVIVGIHFEITENIWLNSLQVYGFPGQGIFIRGKKTDGSKYLTMTSVVSHDNSIDGFKVDQTWNTVIKKCTARHCGDNGFNFASEVRLVDISESTASSNGWYNAVSSSGCGYMLQNNMITPNINTDLADKNIFIRDSTSNDNKKAGICFDDSQNFQASRNKMTKEDTCFFFSGVNAIKVTNNTCTSSAHLYSIYSSIVTIDLTTYNPATMVYVATDNIYTIPQPFVIMGEHATINATGLGFQNQIEIGDQDYTVGFDLSSSLVTTATQQYYNIGPSDNPRVVIQTALDTIATNGGGIVRLLKGTYILDAQIILASHTHLTGAGMDVTILKLKDWANQFPKAGLVRSHLTEHLIISKLTIDGNKLYQYYDDTDTINYGRYGIFTEACLNVWFDSVKITKFQAYGFDPHGWKDGGIWGNYLTLTNCVSTFNDWDGFTLDQTYNIVATGCLSTDNGRHGFNIVTGSKHVQIVNNIANNNGFSDPHGGSGCGYMFQNNQLFGTDNIYVAGNFASISKKSGLCINDIHNMVLDQNTFTDSAYCYDLTDTTNTIITNSTCNTSRYYKVSGTTVTQSVASYNPTTQVLIAPSNIYIKL